MAYQPLLLIGYKQLFKFWSILFQIWLWMLTACGLYCFLLFLKNINYTLKKTNYEIIFIALIAFLMVSCGSNEPKPINLNTDMCDFCKMTIANGKFGF